jgi:hypothetical protein
MQQEEHAMTTTPASIPTHVPAPAAGVISFEQVQQATARCLQVHPAVDSVLPKESFVLAELLGRMIYARRDMIETASLPPATLDELRRWAAPAPLRVAA